MDHQESLKWDMSGGLSDNVRSANHPRMGGCRDDTDSV